MLVQIVSGLRTLGEPSTAKELATYIQERMDGGVTCRVPDDVEAILREYASPTLTPYGDHPPFRRVMLGEFEAWAFSKSFRIALTNSGLDVRLRPLDA